MAKMDKVEIDEAVTAVVLGGKALGRILKRAKKDGIDIDRIHRMIDRRLNEYSLDELEDLVGIGAMAQCNTEERFSDGAPEPKRTRFA